MEKFETLNETERIRKFRAILREFGQLLLFLAFAGASFAWLADDYRSKQFNWYSDTESQLMYKGLPHLDGEGIAFSGVGLLSEEAAHSGTSSIKLNPENPYGFQAEVEDLRGNEQLLLTAWRYSQHPDGQSAGLIAEVRGILWEFKGEVIETLPSGWQKIRLSLSLDCRTEAKTLRIYCWNPTQADVFFDDIQVELKRPGWW